MGVMQRFPGTRARSPWWVLLASLAALALLAAACGNDDDQQAATGGEPRDITRITFRMDWVPNGNYVPFWHAKEQGYYLDEGLDVEILDGGGSNLTIENVAAKQVDFGHALTSSGILAVDDGREIVSVAQVIGKSSVGLFVPEDSGIDDIADIEGGSVIISASGPESSLLASIFSLTGVDGDTVERLAVDPAAKVPTYGRGEGDALLTSIPSANAAVQELRSSNVLLFANAGYPVPDYSIWAHRDTVENDPDLVERFLRATMRGYAEALEDPEGAVEAFIKNKPLLDAEQALDDLRLYQEFYFTDRNDPETHGRHDEEDWRLGLEFMQEHLDVSDGLTHTELYTNDLLPPPANG